VALTISTFRGDGVTPLTGSALACETVNYRVTLQKAGGSGVCAFQGGPLTLTTPDGVVHSISARTCRASAGRRRDARRRPSSAR